MSSGPLRVGVIGTGSLGYHHARLLRDVRGASFRGFFESNADRAGTVSRELGIRAFPTLDTLLADVDVVSIAVPTSYHHQVAKAALEAGKHVLIEKPITTTIEEADELLAIAQRTGALVQIGHIERFNRAIRANARITFATGAVATITASRVSKDRMRKLRIFQRNGYLSLDLAAGTGEMYRLRDDVDLPALVKTAQPIEAFVERVPIDAPEGEPLRLELESFVAACRGEIPVAVSGQDGRDALAVALRIVDDIRRTHPAAAVAGASGA